MKELKRRREDANTDYVKEQEDLWMPRGLPHGLKDGCSRSLLGFIVEGGYSYRAGKAVGLGFVPVIAMAELIEEVDQLGCRGKVMTRQPDTAQYRSAMVEVVI